ncbi:hypothetical protein AAFF_G00237250 [Aldrovandia affinis]|uniref:Uncharacterized protein n=1 Tax=Aldrovandia affinis TaxID=143900 RepID=A0AAD7RE71_9TELE|nr:hypothetical protein AAFF_G00237250 [Aldrovandia affinis]
MRRRRGRSAETDPRSGATVDSIGPRAALSFWSSGGCASSETERWCRVRSPLQGTALSGQAEAHSSADDITHSALLPATHFITAHWPRPLNLSTPAGAQSNMMDY